MSELWHLPSGGRGSGGGGAGNAGGRVSVLPSYGLVPAAIGNAGAHAGSGRRRTARAVPLKNGGKLIEFTTNRAASGASSCDKRV